jgi:hypothetical protein
VDDYYKVDFREFSIVMAEYKKRFHKWEWGDEECIPSPAYILPIMKYCLEHNKSYSELSDEEVNKIFEV